MKILLFHPVRYPPRDYGGIERVVLWLSEGLRDHGHAVSIAAQPGSRLPAGVAQVPVVNGEPFDSVLRRYSFDLVHFHTPPPPDARIEIPHVVTIHGNARPGEAFRPGTVFLSQDHARRHGRSAFVYNGVNPGEFRWSPRRAPGAQPLFLSKTGWKVKNLAGAMRIARRAGSGLTIAGGYRPLPLLLRSALDGFKWAGPVAGDVKAALLAEASCLLFPVRWPEPFGLVMVEAMMSGTPVLGARLGSVPEVLGEHGGIALPLEPEAAWVDAIATTRKFDPAAVREAALARFTHWTMASGYLSYYARAMRGERFA